MTILTCESCDEQFCGECSMGGQCKECEEYICQACWVAYNHMCQHCEKELKEEAEKDEIANSDEEPTDHQHCWRRIDKEALIEFCRCGAERRTQDRPRKYQR